jgi:cytochrome P450
MRRQPTVLPGSLASADYPPERLVALRAEGHEVVTDELGMVVGFLTEKDAEALLTDPRFGAVAMAAMHMSGVADGPLYELWSHLMFGKDGDEHARIRGAVSKHFSPTAVARLEPRAAQIARELAAALPSEGVVDLWPAYAFPLAARTTCAYVGIPQEDALQAGEWALSLVRAFGIMTSDEIEGATQSAVEFGAYVDGLIERKRVDPADDVASALVHGATDVLSAGELRALVANLVFGGLEAVTKSLLTSVLVLVEHGQLAAVADPAVAAHAVAELLRFHPPTPGVARLALEEVDCGGTVLQPGQLASPNLWAVCKDPARYDAPEELRLDRRPGRPYAFGAGPHFCLGFNLAKLQLTTGLRVLAERAPELELACSRDDLTWSLDPFHGPLALPVRIGEA